MKGSIASSSPGTARIVVAEMMAADPASDKIGKAFYEYLAKMESNSDISERAYLSTRQS